MLRLEGLTCGYGAVRAVENLTLEVATGTIFALLGPNGAGKTSTIMAIAGHVPVLAGRVLFDGAEITGLPTVERVRQGIALVPEGRRLFADLTVEENLLVGGYSRPRQRMAENRTRVFDLFPRLAERRRQRAGSLSGGEQQMLAIGRGLMAEPRLLLMDEVSLGLMPKMVDTCYEAIGELQVEGLTVLLVEQNMQWALKVASAVGVLNSGTLVYQNTTAAARNDPTFSDHYFDAGVDRSEAESND
ncbi:MAG: ABC transporter ATP-binding protein [Rhodospirillaceae bacterium]|mgnify:CR=1 FL=1|jgi:branched-chain amino acid transport system ATP-binding protein|nr:ABC transporter ATP-binding protein [Rhodospirillaceae bacterium]